MKYSTLDAKIQSFESKMIEAGGPVFKAKNGTKK